MSESKETNNASTLSSLFRGGSFLFLGRLLSLGLGFLGNILIARFFGPADFGAVSLGLIVITVFGTIGTLGTNTGLSRYIPRTNTPEETRGILRGAFLVVVPFSLCLGAIAFLSADWMATTLFNNPSIDSIIRIFSLGIPMYVLSRCLIGTTRGFKNTRAKVALDYFTKPTIKFLLIAVAIMIGSGVDAVAVAYIAAFTATCILGFVWLRSQLRSPFGAPTHQFIDLYQYSTPLVITSLMTISFAKVDRVFIGYFVSTSSVGIYDAVYQLGTLLLIVMTAFNFLFLPELSQIDAEGKVEQMRTVFHTTTRWLICASLPIFLSMLLFPDVLIRLSYGSEFLSGAIILSVLSIGIFSHVMSGLNRSAMKAIGSTRHVTYGTAAAFVGNIILNFVLVPQYGGLGAAFATTGSYILWNFYYTIALYMKRRITPIQKGLLARITLIAATYIILGKSMTWFLADPTILEALIYGIFVVGTYPVLLFNFNLINKSERETAAGYILTLKSEF